jgi:hypothetical protein
MSQKCKPGTVFRQGDVTFVAVEKLPAKAKSLTQKDEPNRFPKQDAYICAFGEVTGHAHRLTTESDEIEVMINEVERFVNLPEGGTVTHEEHDQIALPPGTYEVRIQREYTDDLEAQSRQVAD